MYRKIHRLLPVAAILLTPMLVMSASAQSGEPKTGVAMMAAVVSEDGKLLRGTSNVMKTKRAARSPVGSYNVIFDRDISECVVTANGAAENVEMAAVTGFVPNTIDVFGYTEINTLTDTAFNLIVYCWK